MAHGWMMFPEFIMEECWENDGKCLPRQLGACFGKSLQEMEEEFPAPWTAKSALEFCKSRKVSCHILHQNRVIERFLPEVPNRRSVCFQVFEKHCYFYRGSVARSIAQMPIRAPSKVPDWKLARKYPPQIYQETIPWDGSFRPGRYHCTDDEIEKIRRCR